MLEYIQESSLDQQLIQEYNTIQEIYSKENEWLKMENRQLAKKLESTNEIILEKDMQIEKLNKEMDEISRYF